MTPLETMKKFVADAAGENGPLEVVQVPRNLFELIAKEMGHPIEDEDGLVVDGVPIKVLSERDFYLSRLAAYALLRWDIGMTPTDMEYLMKAVPDDELSIIGCTIIDTHFEDHNYEDPVDDMDEGEVEDLLRELKEIGFEDVKV